VYIYAYTIRNAYTIVYIHAYTICFDTSRLLLHLVCVHVDLGILVTGQAYRIHDLGHWRL